MTISLRKARAEANEMKNNYNTTLSKLIKQELVSTENVCNFKSKIRFSFDNFTLKYNFPFYLANKTKSFVLILF